MRGAADGGRCTTTGTRTGTRTGLTMGATLTAVVVISERRKKRVWRRVDVIEVGGRARWRYGETRDLRPEMQRAIGLAMAEWLLP